MEFGNQNDSRLESANIFTIHYIRKEIIIKKKDLNFRTLNITGKV